MKALEGSATIRLVDSSSEPDAVIEVLWRGRVKELKSVPYDEPCALEASPDQPPIARRYCGEGVRTGMGLDAVVDVRLTAGKLSVRFLGRSDQRYREWRAAAESAAQQIEKWIRINYGQIKKPANSYRPSARTYH